MAESEPDLLLLDDPWPSGVSKAMVEKLAAAHLVLMLLGQEAGDEDALHALLLGVAEFLVKPVEIAELDEAIRRIIDHAMLSRTGEFYTNVVRLEAPSLLVGESQPLRRLLDELRAVAAFDSTVLILGESGVGKEKVAQEIHRLSERAAGPLMAVDCCSLQESLFESELFGHERGAFTGAAQRKPGLIEQARGGTLFLDEIGEIPPPIQAKLLRVLESRRFRRVGGNEDLSADVRIVAATNRNLEAMVAKGEFREDLLYRLNAFVVSVPPLRDRREDILPLARHFLANFGFSRRVVKRMSETVRLKALGLVEVLFARFDEQLAQRGYVAKAGQMIDATFVEAPRQRNSREDNAKIKAGERPEGWDDPEQAAKRRQKDLDARWTKRTTKPTTAIKTTSTPMPRPS
jgi:DNA-binding NtrC family response regulator